MNLFSHGKNMLEDFKLSLYEKKYSKLILFLREDINYLAFSIVSKELDCLLGVYNSTKPGKKFWAFYNSGKLS